MKKTCLVLCFVCAGLQSLSAAHAGCQKVISGRIVAVANNFSRLGCLNGHADWSVIIHVQHPKDKKAEFVQLDFSLPCDKSPEWLSSDPGVQRFRLIRHKASDSVLTEFFTMMHIEVNPGPNNTMVETGQQTSEQLPAWKLLPGAEREQLPFGQIVPVYQSVDLPLLPVF